MGTAATFRRLRNSRKRDDCSKNRSCNKTYNRDCNRVGLSLQAGGMPHHRKLRVNENGRRWFDGGRRELIEGHLGLAGPLSIRTPAIPACVRNSRKTRAAYVSPGHE